jgi:serine/threonine protein kinase
MEVNITKEQFIRIKKSDIAKDYLLKERLGEGAFGQVFKCQSILSGAERAVKVLKRNILLDPRVK